MLKWFLHRIYINRFTSFEILKKPVILAMLDWMDFCVETSSFENLSFRDAEMKTDWFRVISIYDEEHIQINLMRFLKHCRYVHSNWMFFIQNISTSIRKLSILQVLPAFSDDFLVMSFHLFNKFSTFDRIKFLAKWSNID